MYWTCTIDGERRAFNTEATAVRYAESQICKDGIIPDAERLGGTSVEGGVTIYSNGGKTARVEPLTLRLSGRKNGHLIPNM